MTNEQRQNLDRLTDAAVQEMSREDREVLNKPGAELMGNRILQAVQNGLSVQSLKKRTGTFSAHCFYVCEVQCSSNSGMHGAELTLEVTADKVLCQAWIRK
jgi:hypothetical protein